MKIGKLEFKDYAAQKPLSLSTTGGFLTARDIAAEPSLSFGSLHTLDTADKLKLALARYELEPDFKLAVMGRGILSKTEIMEHMKQQTEFGLQAINVEMTYCNELIASLGPGGPAVPAWPKISKNPIPIRPDWKPIGRCLMLKLKTQALFCENTTDQVTTSFANYRIANVHPVFAARGFTVNVIKDHNDTRPNFIPLAKSSLTVYLGGIGHGNYTTYTGDAFNVILQVGVYDPAEVSGKAIHFLSCETAGQLGPDTVSKGAKSYAGYTENFTFVWDDPNTPVNEVQLFMQADSTFDIAMANGATAQQAYNNTVQAFNAGIAQVPNTTAASWLTYDRDHLKLMGDPNAVIQPYRLVKICFPLASAKLEALAVAGELVEK